MTPALCQRSDYDTTVIITTLSCVYGTWYLWPYCRNMTLYFYDSGHRISKIFGCLPKHKNTAGTGTQPGSKENKPKNQYYPGPNLGQACELFDKLNRAQKNVWYVALRKAQRFSGLCRLELIFITTQPRLGPAVRYPKKLKAQKNWASFNSCC